jgi:hypothetical protein
MGKRTRGGQRVGYNQGDWHANWVELDRHNMDCGPNVFSLLGYADRDTCNLLADRTVNGISGDTIVDILNEAYEGEHTWHHIEKDKIKGSLLQQIKEYLWSKEATLASVGGDGHGHYFVVYRNKNTLIAIDAQSRWTAPLNEYLMYMERERKMDGDTFYLMSSTNVLQHYNQVTKEMVDRYFPESTWGEDGDQWVEDGSQAHPEFGQTSGFPAFGGQKFKWIGKSRRNTKKRKPKFHTSKQILNRGGSDYEGQLLLREDNEKGSDSFPTY